MATCQTVLDMMEMLDRELEVQVGEADAAVAVKAVNAAVAYMESVVALHPQVFGSSTGTVTTAADTETTDFPSGVLRIDRLQFIDPTTSRPIWDLEAIGETGGHVYSTAHPLLVPTTTQTGRPVRYWTDGSKIYWDPEPNATHTVRWYGFSVHGDLSASTTITYPDIVLLPLASFATRIMGMGKGDVVNDIQSLAVETFDPIVMTLSRFNRDKAPGYSYKYVHTE